MNKIKYILTLLLLSAMPVFAESSTSEALSMCPATPVVNGPISAALSKYSGMNYLVSTTLESQVRRQMNKALSGNFKVDITPFGAMSMLEGKFKSIEANSDSAIIDGLYLSNVSGQSLCGYNRFVYKNGEVLTAENFLLGFRAEITSNDLQKMMNTPEYTRLLNSLNVNFGNVSVLKVFDPKAEIKDNKLIITVRYMAPLAMREPKKASIKMGIIAQDGNIEFTDIETMSGHSAFNVNGLLPILNKLNPLAFNADVLNNSKSIIKLKDVAIINDRIIIKGLVIVPKNYYNN